MNMMYLSVFLFITCLIDLNMVIYASSPSLPSSIIEREFEIKETTTRRYKKFRNKSNYMRRREEKLANEPDFESINSSPFSSQSTSSLTNSTNELEFLNQEGKVTETTKKLHPIQMNITAVVGQEAILPCSVRNLGSHHILWLRVRDGDVLAFDEMMITQESRFRVEKKTPTQSNLVISNIQPRDAGEYACQINTNSVKSKFINLVILTPPEFRDTEENPHENQIELANSLELQDSNLNPAQSINVIEGKHVTLECNAYGSPKPTINWYVKRYKSDNLTVFSLNSNKIIVNNVMRKQYDYFECEASNKVPPSISKKFKINVLYRPEVSVSPMNVYVSSLPAKVKFNCTISSFPSGNIFWIRNHKHLNPEHSANHKRLRSSYTSGQSHARRMNNKTIRHRTTHKHRHFIRDSYKSNPKRTRGYSFDDEFILKPTNKYKIRDNAINDTLKLSSIVITIENENDFGVYECYSNNSAGYKAVKFYIYGELFKSIASANKQSDLKPFALPTTTLYSDLMHSKPKLDEIIIENDEPDKSMRDEEKERLNQNLKITKKTTNKVFNLFSFSNEHNSFTTTIQSTETEKPRSFIESILGTESTSSASFSINKRYDSLFTIRLSLTVSILFFCFFLR